MVTAAEDNRSAPKHALERLRNARNQMGLEADDECWLVLDTDHHLEPNHRANFIQLMLDAENEGFRVALSCPCFEFWLLLHHVDENSAGTFRNCAEVEKSIRSVVGEYNKTNLKREHFSDRSIENATLRAERLDASIAGGHLPEAPTTRIYKLIRAITARGVPADLPPEPRPLLIPE